MSEIAATSPSLRFSVPIHWTRAVSAGVVATIVMTVIGAIIGMNFPKMIGSMMLPNGSLAMQYTAGGIMHFMIGIIYGIIYVAVVARLVEWNRFIKALVYGLAITAIAFAAMPLMSAMMGGGSKASAGNPCHSQAEQQAAMNPCHSQQPSSRSAAQAGAMNPCHPSSGMAAPYQQASGSSNPCHMKAGGGGNPGNPCGGGGGPWNGVMSVVNHLVYALALAFTYGKVGK